MHRLLTLFLLLPFCMSAQLLDEDDGVYGEDWGGYLWGIRGGFSLGSQDWSNIETELNLGFHGDLFLESIPAQGTFSFWGSVGYHQRGSRISRRRAITFQGNGVTLPADDFVFNNLVLSIGGKQVVAPLGLGDAYYLIGVRAEYNVGTNLEEYDLLSTTQGIAFRSAYPLNSYEFINRFTYGATVGGGVILPLTERIGGFVELTAQPDLSFQYNQGPINNVVDPFGSGNTTLGERAIRNFTIEISLGLRFLRKWRYID
ncbi:hypothetical protein CLV84_2615 [Neolewinella xylanilytica]|uniref:Outer membrane protein with beta-barrel domain n=1 Tax=Neolewinella xylanilytica TaxID=1514080 RepID=A0A2S6I3E9_9BACT|nr:hypothetical protein [Neolewinella xylanilytica]PPK85712.1 hypothetical protein CLV84_2615 [Neolewinella xylanilytica]